MKKSSSCLDLSGEWELSSDHLDKPIAATVPGCVHADLLASGIIADPYFRDNETAVQWIGEADWCYRREFDVSEDFLLKPVVVLRCEGLDTLAGIFINGHVVGRADNMFRTWEFSVKEFLKPGRNNLEVRFASAVKHARRKQEEHFLWHTGLGHHRISGGNWLRKEQCNFGWDWGPMLVTCGIWRSLSLIGHDSSGIGGVKVVQELEQNGIRVQVEVSVMNPEYSKGELFAQIRLSREGNTVCECSSPVIEACARLEACVGNPELWWPNGMGEQPLYELESVLLTAEGKIIDRDVRRIGLRTLELVRENDAWGQSFKFRVNGVDFFAKGANWIPADTFDCRVSDADLRDLLESAAAANMNFVRVWGGGLYERDAFYDVCDELGLCVWQDFMFACSAYPAHEREFLENVRIEAEQNVKRLRHHACLAVWCGNNEMEQIPGIIGDGKGEMSWPHYSELFDRVLGDVVRGHDPQRDYWPSSEHSPIGNRTANGASSDPRWGDAHLWTVWHGREPFEWYRSSFHRFCSEFGFQAFPHPATVEGFTLPGDRNITSHVMEHHQRSPIGNSAVIDYLLDWFRFPVGWENTVWLSQILQGLAIQYAVEHWRRNMPRCMGAIYWQLNDCWPVASWSSIDSRHRWKALHYAARRFFEPLHVSAVEDPVTRELGIFVTHDGAGKKDAVVRVFAETPSGERVLEQSVPGTLSPRGTAAFGKIDCSEVLDTHGPRGLVFMLELEVDGETVSRNLTLFARPKHLELERPNLSVEIVGKSREGAVLAVSTDKPALWVRLEMDRQPDQRWSDNFFHLHAGETRQVRVWSSGGFPHIRDGAVSAFDLTSTYRENESR
jgi:beta-mannosidase